MSRDIAINGEAMVSVKGRSDSSIANLTQLGLAVDAVRLSFEYVQDPIIVDAYGPQIPMDLQVNLASVYISMTLVHYDRDVLAFCVQESFGGGSTEGSLVRAGQRMGNNLPRFAPGGVNGNHYIGLNIFAPVSGIPWRFWYAYLTAQPTEIPLGTQRSLVSMTWRAIPYTQDPWGGSASQPGTTAGGGATGAIIFDHTLDS